MTDKHKMAQMIDIILQISQNLHFHNVAVSILGYNCLLFAISVNKSYSTFQRQKLWGALGLIWPVLCEAMAVAANLMVMYRRFFAFQHFKYHISVEHVEKTSTAQIWWKLIHIIYGGPRYGRKFLISHIEISVNCPGSSYQKLPGQFTLHSMGLIRYSSNHILGPHERFMYKLVCAHHVLLKYGHANTEIWKQ